MKLAKMRNFNANQYSSDIEDFFSLSLRDFHLRNLFDQEDVSDLVNY